MPEFLSLIGVHLNGFQVLSRFEIWIQNSVCFCRLTADRPRPDGGPSARHGFAEPSAGSASVSLGRTVRTISGGQSAPGLDLFCKKIFAALLIV